MKLTQQNIQTAPDETIYLEYVNNFLSTDKMAEHFQVNPFWLSVRIVKGRTAHENRYLVS